MENVDLNSVRDSLLNESVDAANGLIDQWFASQIADLKCALDAKAAALAAPEPQTLDGTMGAPVDMDIAVPVDGSVGMMEPIDAPMAAPAPAAPVAPMAPPAAPVDFSEPAVEPAPVEPEAAEEPAEPEVEEAEEPEVDPAAEDAVEAISADLEQLKADFLELLAQAELPTDVLDGAEEAEEAETEEDAEKQEDDSEAAADEEKEDEDDAEAEAEEDEKEDTDEAVEEAVEVVEDELDEDALALEEAFKLKTVTDKLQNVEGAQVGEAGKIPVQTKSPVVSKPAKSREGGEAVVNKGGEAKGFEMEKAPKVADVKLKDGKPGNAKEEGKKVSKEGDKSAVLNKSQGAENTKSPVGSVKGFKK